MQKNATVACSQDRSDQIGEFSAGRLQGEEVLELLRHLEDCPACSEEFDLVAGLLEAEDQLAHVLPKRRARRWLRPVPAAAAAVLLLAGGIWSLWVSGSQGRASRALASLEPIPFAEVVLRSGEVPRDEIYSEAMKLYGSGRYSEMAELVFRTFGGFPKDPLLNLYLGVALLQSEKEEDLSSAVAALQAASQAGEGLLRERAEWYLANAYLKQGEPAAAKTVLETLVSGAGDYELNAREKLQAVEALLRK